MEQKEPTNIEEEENEEMAEEEQNERNDSASNTFHVITLKFKLRKFWRIIKI